MTQEVFLFTSQTTESSKSPTNSLGQRERNRTHISECDLCTPSFSDKSHPRLNEIDQTDRNSVEHNQMLPELVSSPRSLCSFVAPYIRPHTDSPGRPPVFPHDIIPHHSGSYYQIPVLSSSPRGVCDVSPSVSRLSSLFLCARPILRCLLINRLHLLPRQRL